MSRLGGVGMGLALVVAGWPLARGQAEEGINPEPGYVGTEATYQATSDAIIDRRFAASYRTHRRDPDWAFPGEAKQAWDFGALTELHTGQDATSTYSGWKVGGLVGRKFSDALQIDLSGGPTILSTTKAASVSNSKATPFFDFSTFWHPRADFSLNVHWDRDYIYPELILPGGADQSIVANSINLDAHYLPWEWIRVGLRTSYRIFTDSNTRRYADVSAMYGICRSVPWIWAGFGLEYLAYAQANATYWSPQNFTGFGPRIEVDVPLFSKFSGLVGVNANRIQQDSFDSAYGYYASAKLRYGTRESALFEVGYTRIQSLQESSNWNDDALTLGLSVSL